MEKRGLGLVSTQASAHWVICPGGRTSGFKACTLASPNLVILMTHYALHDCK